MGVFFDNVSWNVFQQPKYHLIQFYFFLKLPSKYSKISSWISTHRMGVQLKILKVAPPNPLFQKTNEKESVAQKRKTTNKQCKEHPP